MSRPSTAARPPGPKGLPLIGSLAALIRHPLRVLSESARMYGDIVRILDWPFRAYLVNHPDFIRGVLITHNREFGLGNFHQTVRLALGDGLSTSEGALHLKQRRLIQPAFHRQRIANYGTTMADYSVRQTANWREGEVLDLHKEMIELTLRIAAKTLFNSDVSEDVRQLGKATAFANQYIMRRYLNPLGPMLHRLPLPSTRRFHRVMAELDRAIERGIADHEAAGRDTGDVLSMLMDARDVEGDGTGMSRHQVRDEVITLMAAGYETISNGLAWTWYLLSQHPHVEAAMHAELGAVLAGRRPEAGDLPRLTYTEKVFTESMRLYPPIWGTSRTALEDVRLGEYVIPKGGLVFVSPYVTHRDPRWFPEPLAFRPERWTPAFKESLPRFAYFPFGGGPRQCIGESFAWMEGILVLAAIAQHWRMKVVPGHTVVPKPLAALHPDGGLPVNVYRRETGIGSGIQV